MGGVYRPWLVWQAGASCAGVWKINYLPCCRPFSSMSGAAEARAASSAGSLHLAAAAGDVEAVRRLLAAAPDPAAALTARDARGRTALHCAAQTGQLGVVRLVLASHPAAAKEAASALDGEGLTAAHLASFGGHAGVARLLRSEEPVRTPDNDGARGGSRQAGT